MASINPPQSQVLTRSRTLLFLSFRDTRSSSSYPPRLSRSKGKQRQTDDVEQEALLSNNDDSTAIDMDESSALPPRWVDYADEVDELIDQIKPQMVQLDKLTAKHILPGFTDRSSEERKIEALTTEITRSFRKCQLLIKKIADFGVEIESHIQRSSTQKSQGHPSKYTYNDLKLVKNAQIAVATKVQNLSTLFQKRQRIYLQQLKGYEDPPQDNQNALFAIDDDSNSSEFHSTVGHGHDSRHQQAQLQQRGHNQHLEQRAKEVDGIANSIAELADMFKDLGNLVLDQGTLFDRIDYNVEQMSTDVRGAVQELKTATQYQKRTGKCRIILLLILLIFAAVLVLIYKPRHKSDSKLNNQSSHEETTHSPQTRSFPPIAQARQK